MSNSAKIVQKLKSIITPKRKKKFKNKNLKGLI
jgi:hypothetical protein